MFIKKIKTLIDGSGLFEVTDDNQKVYYVQAADEQAALTHVEILNAEPEEEPADETPSLQEQITTLQKQTDTLEECILEMSEIVYA